MVETAAFLALGVFVSAYDSMRQKECRANRFCVTREGKLARVPLRKIIVIAVMGLLGHFLFGPTSAMAEEDINTALRAYDTATPTDRKTAEIVFANTQNGIWWANAVLIYKKQPPLFCPPDNWAALPGPQVIEMVRRIVNENPELGKLPYGLVIMRTIALTYPCKD